MEEEDVEFNAKLSKRQIQVLTHQMSSKSLKCVFIYFACRLDSSNTILLPPRGHGLADRHDRQLPDQHRRGRPHVLLLQLEAHAAHPVLPALHRPVGGLPGQDAHGLRQAGQAGHGDRRTGQTLLFTLYNLTNIYVHLSRDCLSGIHVKNCDIE